MFLVQMRQKKATKLQLGGFNNGCGDYPDCRVAADTSPRNWARWHKTAKILCQAPGQMSSPKYRQFEWKKLDSNHFDEKVIFTKWFRHWRTGKIIYPKNGKVIVIRIKNKPNKSDK